MLLQPKRTKFKKFKKNYLSHKIETKSYKLNNGFIGLKALESIRITSRQIEAVRKCVNRDLGRKGKVWINIFPHIRFYILELNLQKGLKIKRKNKHQRVTNSLDPVQNCSATLVRFCEFQQESIGMTRQSWVKNAAAVVVFGIFQQTTLLNHEARLLRQFNGSLNRHSMEITVIAIR